MKVAQLCPTLATPWTYTVHGILQARILEWVAFPFSRASSQPRDQIQVSCIAGGFFTNWAVREGSEWRGRERASLTKKAPENSFLPPLCEDTEGRQLSKNQELPLTPADTKSPNAFILDFSDSRTLRSKVVLFINHLVYGTLLLLHKLRQEAIGSLGVCGSVGLLGNSYVCQQRFCLWPQVPGLGVLILRASNMRSSMCSWPYLKHAILPGCTPPIYVYHFKTSNTVNPQRFPVSHWNVFDTSLQIRAHCLILLTFPSSSMYSQVKYGFLRDKSWHFCSFCIQHST